MHRPVALSLMIFLAACSGTDVQDESTQSAAAQSSEEYPDVVEATLEPDGDGTFTASVTLSSPYDSPNRYADAWRLLSADRLELGIRVLTHDHAGEQPFTRSQSGIAIPDDLDEVIVQGRDLVNGWGGQELQVGVPGR